MTAALYHKKLARVLERMGSTYLVSDILTAIAEGKMQSFVDSNSWAITQVAIFPRARLMTFFIAVGDLEDMPAPARPHLEYADENDSPGAGLWSAGWLRDAKSPAGRSGRRVYFIREKCDGRLDHNGTAGLFSQINQIPQWVRTLGSRIMGWLNSRKSAVTAISRADGCGYRAADPAGLEFCR